jgi:hypothetical protein
MLKDARPTELPVLQSTKVGPVISLKTAKARGRAPTGGPDRGIAARFRPGFEGTLARHRPMALN